MVSTTTSKESAPAIAVLPDPEAFWFCIENANPPAPLTMIVWVAALRLNGSGRNLWSVRVWVKSSASATPDSALPNESASSIRSGSTTMA